MDTDQIRDKLNAKRQELLERVDRTSKHLYQRDEPVSPNFAEQSVEMENQELIYTLDREGKEEIRKIGKALERLDHGDYGLCVNCGEDISEQRLEALPYADVCIDCAE
jgi:DnaK suppressor protein